MSETGDISSMLDSLAPPTAGAVITEEPIEELGYDQWAYAKDCAWVWTHLGERPSLKAAGSGGRFELWKYAAKNKKEFTTQIMPKVAPTLVRLAARTPTDDAIKQAERKSIESLQVFWRSVVRTAESGI